MNSSILKLLYCPFCGGKLNIAGTDHPAIEAEYSILTCYCSRFSVVAGIPIIEKSERSDEVVSLIEAGENAKALLTLMPNRNFSLPKPYRLLGLLPRKVDSWLRNIAHEKARDNWRRKASLLLKDQKSTTTARDLLDFYLQNKEHYYYFAFRFGQPRHLVALSFATLIRNPKKPVLDLSCGCGTITRNLVYRAKDTLVIGTDKWFLGLYIAKNWIAPMAEYVCCSSDTSLPFPDGSFSAINCSDAFHYCVNKVTAFSELKRLINNEGFIMLNWTKGLPPEGYHELVADMPHRLVADRDVLSRYLEGQGPPLAQSADIQYLRKMPTFSLVASYRQEMFRNYGLFDHWPHAEGRLRLNPLYTQDKKHHSGDIYTRRFPSREYEEKHSESKQYLPEKIEIHPQLLKDLLNGKHTPEMEPLIRQCVLLDIPEMFD